MARSYGAVFHRIWADPTWRALHVDAQHLYVLLISQPQMNMAGVIPLQLRKWASCVHGWDTTVVAEALDSLRSERFVVVDKDTEEVLIRTLIRNDGAYKTPGMLTSILKFAEAVQGPELRTVLAVELGKLDALNGKTASAGMASIAATRAALSPTSGPTRPTGEPIPDGIADGIADGIRDGIGDTFIGSHPGYLPQDPSEPIADTSGSGSGSGPLLSLVGTVAEESTSPPPADAPLCRKHDGWDRNEIPGCRACMSLREKWEAQVVEHKRAEANRPRVMCGQHPGQIAEFCSPCRSEKIGKSRWDEIA